MLTILGSRTHSLIYAVLYRDVCVVFIYALWCLSMISVVCLSMVCCGQLRNKPREPPQRPKSAPFFLPTVAGLEPTFRRPDGETAADASVDVCRGFTHGSVCDNRQLLIINHADNKS